MKYKLQKNVKEEFIKVNKTLNLIFRVVYSNPRTYVFVFLLSGMASMLLAWLWNNYSQYILLPPILLNFLSISVFVSSYYLGIYLTEWRKKNFLKRIKIININEYGTLFVIFLVNLSLSFISMGINIILYNLYVLIPVFNFHLPLLSNIRSFIWIIYFFTMIVFIFFLTVLYVFLSTAFLKRSLSFIALSLVTLFLLIFSDVVIQPTISNKYWVFIIIGYFCPTKYFVWFNMLITSYQFLDPLGISQIIQNYKTAPFISFPNLGYPCIGIVFYTTVFIYLAKRFFNWGMKG